MRHTLIVGPRHIGKTTLINGVLRELDRPVYGYQTKKETALSDEQMREPVYIYEPGKPRFQSTENLIGYCSPCLLYTSIPASRSFALTKSFLLLEPMTPT